jgi:hypothetical protein
MYRCALALAGVLFVFAPAPVTAQDTSNDVACFTMNDSPKLDASAGKIMAGTCELAAAAHKSSADGLRGKPKQEELVREATFLFYASKGELIAGNISTAVRYLGLSRRLFADVRNHGADKDVRGRAQQGLTMVDTTIKKLKNS